MGWARSIIWICTLLSVSISADGNVPLPLRPLPLPADPRDLRVFIYPLPTNLSCCDFTPASPCRAMLTGGKYFNSNRVQQMFEPNFAEAPVRAALERSGRTVADPRQAHAFYLPACLVGVAFNLRDGRQRERRGRWGQIYENALVDFMNKEGPFWREQRARHLVHHARCDFSKLHGTFLFPRLWPQAEALATVKLCWEVGREAANSSLPWPPHVFLPYYVPTSQYESVPNAELLSLRPTRIAFRGSLATGRGWIEPVLVSFPRSGLWVQMSRMGIDERDQAQLNRSFALVQLSLQPMGDTVHRRSAFESIAAGALPLWVATHDPPLQSSFMPLSSCLPPFVGVAATKRQLEIDAEGVYARASARFTELLPMLARAQRLFNWHSSEFDECLFQELRGALALPHKTNRPRPCGENGCD
mmetsp:Transcript_40907/g.94745  ORF Transcript_40907/g.94745 Transcript_40907/m.94745 type:complete len:416 (-) Transcript_40907:170-1417(-)